MFDLTQEMCEAAGLPAYEVSNHARPGAECRHNQLYWQGGDYLGIGPGAHGRCTDHSGTTSALRQYKTPEKWLSAVAEKSHGTQEETILTAEERLEELVMMGLRLTEGLDGTRFQRQTGRKMSESLDQSGLATMLDEGMLIWRGPYLLATPKGRLLLNSVIAALLP